MASPVLIADDPFGVAPPLVERFAREDAASDLQADNCFWYLQFAQWSLVGVISEEAWQRYQVVYTAARRALLATDTQAPA